MRDPEKLEDKFESLWRWPKSNLIAQVDTQRDQLGAEAMMFQRQVTGEAIGLILELTRPIFLPLELAARLLEFGLCLPQLFCELLAFGAGDLQFVFQTLVFGNVTIATSEQIPCDFVERDTVLGDRLK